MIAGTSNANATASHLSVGGSFQISCVSASVGDLGASELGSLVVVASAGLDCFVFIFADELRVAFPIDAPDPLIAWCKLRRWTHSPRGSDLPCLKQVAL